MPLPAREEVMVSLLEVELGRLDKSQRLLLWDVRRKVQFILENVSFEFFKVCCLPGFVILVAVEN